MLIYKVFQARNYHFDFLKKSPIIGQFSEETMKNIFEKQVRWQSDIRDFCNRNKQFETLRFHEIQSRLVIDQKYKFAYCQIPKVCSEPNLNFVKFTFENFSKLIFMHHKIIKILYLVNFEQSLIHNCLNLNVSQTKV